MTSSLLLSMTRLSSLFSFSKLVRFSVSSSTLPVCLYNSTSWALSSSFSRLAFFSINDSSFFKFVFFKHDTALKRLLLTFCHDFATGTLYGGVTAPYEA